MDGEIDLELYTICIIRLNSAFQKIEDNEIDSEVKSMLDDCVRDLSELCKDIESDMEQEEINYNEYDYFFENGLQLFPGYFKTTENYYENMDDGQAKDRLLSIMELFNKLLKFADDYFKMRGIV